MQTQHFPGPRTGLISEVPTLTTGPTPLLKVRLWRRLWSEEEGQTLVEYGLLIGLIALVVVAAVTIFGRRLNDNLYGTSNNGLPLGT